MRHGTAFGWLGAVVLIAGGFVEVGCAACGGDGHPTRPSYRIEPQVAGTTTYYDGTVDGEPFSCTTTVVAEGTANRLEATCEGPVEFSGGYDASGRMEFEGEEVVLHARDAPGAAPNVTEELEPGWLEGCDG